MVLHAAVAKQMSIKCCRGGLALHHAGHSTLQRQQRPSFKQKRGLDELLKNAKVYNYWVEIYLTLAWVLIVRKVTMPLVMGLRRVQK